MSGGLRTWSPRKVVLSMIVGCFVIGAILFWVSRVTTWEPLRSKHSGIEAGNRALGRGSATSALAHYNSALKTLSREPGAHLDRALALRAVGKKDESRQALIRASELEGPRSVRADAFFNLGIDSYQRGEAQLKSKAYNDAQKSYQEAAEHFKRALRNRPQDEPAAWDLELALLQLERARKKEAQKKQQQSKETRPEDKNDPQSDQTKPGDTGKEQARGEPSQTPSKPKTPTPSTAPREAEAPVVPAEAARILDTLQQREESLERHKAHLRALQDNRRPTKDW